MIRARLKGATRLLFHDMGGLEASAALLNLSVSQVGRYQHASQDDFITIAGAAVLESQHGVGPHVTQALAAINGSILVPRPPMDGDGRWVSHLAATVKETGEFMSTFGSALANDGTVSPEEALRLIQEADQALSALMAVRSELERHAGLTPKAPPG